MRYLGLIFYKDDDSGIATINVTDTATGIKLLDNKLIDLFQKDQDATFGKYEEFILWVTLPFNTPDRYTWTVEHSGTNNVSAVGTNYAINFMGYVTGEEIIKAHTTPKVVLIDKINTLEYPFEFGGTIAEYSYDLVKETTKKLYITTNYSTDGVASTFKVGSDTLYAYKFVRFSVDNGVNWKYPYDLDITWGSNSPDFDNETINTDGEFWVNFLDIPDSGKILLIDAMPTFDVVRFEAVLNQPSDGMGFVDYNLPFAVQEYAIEFKI